ncbi:hypothetical protein EH165_09015 [Nakamurella antarctica]|uniref:YCII-related domain-containing protein n=1 Tax=Nakamurella antarctica TaxID=1902245 RepID=A0A3G8ZN74_9ACTN|nr:YciI family protein [Nakamurella antarctica]AZI58257.1 hypothetical protein EH165_09015 [Nakamurella antarctica]
MTVFAVQYFYNDKSAARDTHRPAHRAYLKNYLTSGALLASGPYTDDARDGALLIFSVPTPTDLHEILESDPFSIESLIDHVDIRAWNPVMGPWADNPT